MMTRSRIHLLLAAGARIEETGGDPKIAKAFKDAAQWEATLRAESRDGSWKRDEKRIDRQRTLFAMIPDSRALTIFRDAVLQRAYDLLCDGDVSACDALLEFMPSAEADKLLEAWSSDQDNDKPLSPWYAGKGAVA